MEEGTYNVTDYTEEQDSCMMREIVATIQGHSEEEEEEGGGTRESEKGIISRSN